MEHGGDMTKDDIQALMKFADLARKDAHAAEDRALGILKACSDDSMTPDQRLKNLREAMWLYQEAKELRVGATHASCMASNANAALDRANAALDSGDGGDDSGNE
jgi:hypothetical protein